MAADTQWPSEDEDFDAITDSKSSKTVKTGMATAEPLRKSVAVMSADESTITDEAVANPAEDPIVEKVSDTPDLSAGSETTPTEEASEASIPAPNPKPVPNPIETPSRATISQNTKSPIGHLFLEILLVIALAGLGFWAMMLLSDNKDLKSDNASLKNQVAQLNANPQIAVQKQTEDLLKKVGALMQLPTGETPTVANVSDAEAAKKQSAFFSNAQNGDRVLMYVKAGQAILYRPSTNKIVLVAPLTFTGSSPAASTTPAAKKP